MCEREGELIYSEEGVEVRTFPNRPGDYNVYIGEGLGNYFLFQRGSLEQFAERTPMRKLEEGLRNYNERINPALKENNLSPEQFALILARTRIKSLQAELDHAE